MGLARSCGLALRRLLHLEILGIGPMLHIVLENCNDLILLRDEMLHNGDVLVHDPILLDDRNWACLPWT